MPENYNVPSAPSVPSVPSSPHLDLTVPAELAGLRLDQALARLLPEYSRSRITAWVRAEQVRIAGAIGKPKQKVWGGERISMDAPPAPESSAFQAESYPLDVVFEDDTLLVIDKPAGLVVHPGSGNWNGTMLNALLHRCPELAQVPRAGIVHRLDKDTSGLLVVAKTITAQTHLVRQLQQRSVGRIYNAIVCGDIERAGDVDAPIGRHPVHRTRMAVVAAGRSARTYYRPLERFKRATLVECRLDTGRTHQIRVHLASIGHPLLGDPVYGRRETSSPPEDTSGLRRQGLHAVALEIDHPVNRTRMRWASPLPPDLAAVLAALRTGERR